MDRRRAAGCRSGADAARGAVLVVPVPADDPRSCAAGHRVVCPDLVGFGRSDKPTRREDHGVCAPRRMGCARWRSTSWASPMRHSSVRTGRADRARLAAEHPERFARLVVANTGLPTGDLPMPGIWWEFRNHPEPADRPGHGISIQMGCVRPMSDAVRAGIRRTISRTTTTAPGHAMPGGADVAGRSTALRRTAAPRGRSVESATRRC